MTIIEICNAALSVLGHDQFVTALADATAEARWCNTFYDQDRKELLRVVKPKWAARWEALADREDIEHPSWLYQFPVPGDCLAIQCVKDSSGYHVPFLLQEEMILTNCDEGIVEFTIDEDDPELFDPQFCRALIDKLASDLCMPITGKVAAVTGLTQLATARVAEARGMDADEGRNVGFPADANYYVTSRS